MDCLQGVFPSCVLLEKGELVVEEAVAKPCYLLEEVDHHQHLTAMDQLQELHRLLTFVLLHL